MLSLLLIALLILGLIPSSAYATGTTTDLVEKEYTSEGCTITYRETSTWGNYVNADVIIENTTDSDKSLWQLELVYGGTIDSIWNADIVSSDNGTYVIAAKTYNTTIAAGQSVSFGFQAYGEEGKPEVPESITYVKENTDDAIGSEEEDSDSSSTGQDYAIPAEWKGLNYAMFTSGEEALSLYTNTTSITGSVHTNEDFYYQGTSLKVDGVLESAKGITLNTASGAENLQISSKLENAEVISMPDITEELSAYVKENGSLHEVSMTVLKCKKKAFKFCKFFDAS